MINLNDNEMASIEEIAKDYFRANPEKKELIIERWSADKGYYPVVIKNEEAH